MRTSLLFLALLVPAGAATAQGTVATAPDAQPLKVVLELVNDPSASKLHSYVATLHDEIQERWYSLIGPPPRRNLPEGQEAIVSVTIRPDGHPSDVKLLGKTTRKDFDETARRAVAEANFPAVPPGMPASQLLLRVHFLVQRYGTAPAPR